MGGIKKERKTSEHVCVCGEAKLDRIWPITNPVRPIGKNILPTLNGVQYKTDAEM
jgi:hypothetical protein